MTDRKPWELGDADPREEEKLQVQPEPKPQYEVVKAFSHGMKKVKPGDAVPKGISDAAMAHLLRKGVLREL